MAGAGLQELLHQRLVLARFRHRHGMQIPHKIKSIIFNLIQFFLLKILIDLRTY